MISFTQLCERLARGQLKNLAAVEDSNLGEIVPEYVPTVLSLANSGLVDLSTRFPLVSKQIDLVFETGTYYYPLSAAGVGTYLDESLTEVFDDELFVKVLNIYDESGIDHPIDTNGHIMTPTYNVLRFSAAKMLELGEKCRIRYQARHPEIGELDNIEIPPNLEFALQLYVASMYITNMNSPEHTAKGDSYYAAYLRHIGEDEMRNLSSTSEIHEDNRFQDRGFV
jgi:hypothetical protein